jgi:hypothetical protein
VHQRELRIDGEGKRDGPEFVGAAATDRELGEGEGHEVDEAMVDELRGEKPERRHPSALSSVSEILAWSAMQKTVV